MTCQRSRHNSLGMRFTATLIVVVTLTLCACGSAQGPAATADASFDVLAQRPLQFPSLAAGESCPVSPQVSLPTAGIQVEGRPVPVFGFGSGPVYLSGQERWFAGQVALFLAGPSYDGPALVRGRRLDAPGGFPFTDPGGRTSIGRSSQPGKWRMAFTSLQPNLSPGCYVVQVDGTSFSEVVVFSLQAGPPPPG
jgi:hypothetical protein